MSAPATVTPAMRQYLDAKQQHRDAILLFRMGDFYEIFYEDALVASRALDLTLTSRAKDGQGAAIPMCGVPHRPPRDRSRRVARHPHRQPVSRSARARVSPWHRAARDRKGRRDGSRESSE